MTFNDRADEDRWSFRCPLECDGGIVSRRMQDRCLSSILTSVELPPFKAVTYKLVRWLGSLIFRT